MKTQVRVLSIILLITSFAFIFPALAENKYEKVKEPLSEFELGRYQYCGEDRDCVAANNGCCDCANGGKDVAINKERTEAFKARFDCMQVMCTEMAAEPMCGSGLVSCVNHRCKYFERSEAAPIPTTTAQPAP